MACAAWLALQQAGHPAREHEPGEPAEAERGAFDDAYRFETGDNWTGLRAEDSRSENRLA